MKKFLASVAVVLTCTGMAFADAAYDVKGKIVDIQPIFTKVSQQVPTQQCYEEDRYVGGGGTADTAAGAIIGGAIGNQFGEGDGKTAMTVLGAILGADVATRNANNGHVERVTVCDTVYTAQAGTVVNEYEITYDVDGVYVIIRVNSAQGERARIGQRQLFRVTYHPLN
jgi:uncharacterized protein YcfJ